MIYTFSSYAFDETVEKKIETLCAWYEDIIYKLKNIQKDESADCIEGLLNHFLCETADVDEMENYLKYSDRLNLPVKTLMDIVDHAHRVRSEHYYHYH